MFINSDFLREHGACRAGAHWFMENYSEGAEHKVVIEKLVDEDRIPWASWLKDEVKYIEMKEMASSFKVGDRVRIKAWEDMVKEFGVDSDGDILAYFCFSKEMEYLCGAELVIEEIDEFCIQGVGNYQITVDMIEKVEEPVVVTVVEESPLDTIDITYKFE